MLESRKKGISTNFIAIISAILDRQMHAKATRITNKVQITKSAKFCKSSRVSYKLMLPACKNN
jgi:peptide subunit release factor RF-3